jgi:hypothetical protein
VSTFVNDTQNYLFVCKFSAMMRDEDCIKKMPLGIGNRGLRVRTNSANKIVVSD